MLSEFTLEEIESIIKGMEQGASYTPQGNLAGPGDPVMTLKDLLRRKLDLTGLHYRIFHFYTFVFLLNPFPHSNILTLSKSEKFADDNFIVAHVLNSLF